MTAITSERKKKEHEATAMFFLGLFISDTTT